jgi:hypothetical protein
MAVALLALFVALGGTGYAAAKLNGRNLVDHSVKGRKLAHNTLTGTQIKESALGRVPSAADSDFLDGRPASAYLLAGTGVAFNSAHLGGLDANAFLRSDGVAANSQMLQGNPAAAFLRAGATAADAALLGGRPPSDFAAADEDQGAGPITIAMPAANGASDERTLITHGPLTLVAACQNNGGQPEAVVAVQGAGYHLAVGEVTGATTLQAGTSVIADIVAGGAVKVDRHGFTALSPQPASGLQGAATAIADGASHACTMGAYAFTS